MLVFFKLVITKVNKLCIHNNIWWDDNLNFCKLNLKTKTIYDNVFSILVKKPLCSQLMHAHNVNAGLAGDNHY